MAATSLGAGFCSDAADDAAAAASPPVPVPAAAVPAAVPTVVVVVVRCWICRDRDHIDPVRPLPSIAEPPFGPDTPEARADAAVDGPAELLPLSSPARAWDAADDADDDDRLGAVGG
jgi:hypothetical protein